MNKRKMMSTQRRSYGVGEKESFTSRRRKCIENLGKCCWRLLSEKGRKQGCNENEIE